MKENRQSDFDRGSDEEFVARIVWKCLRYFTLFAVVVMIIAFIVRMVGD
jgi:hypothetical protein